VAYFDASNGRRVGVSSKQRRDDPLGYKRALDFVRRKAEDGQAAKVAGVGSAWDVWVEPWFRTKFEQAHQARSLKAELHRWRWVRAFLAERKIAGPMGVTYQIGLDFMAWRQEHKTRSGKGGHNNALGELRLLGRVMREAVRRGFVPASPLERMGLKRHKSPEKPEISSEEVFAIRAALLQREGALEVRDRWMTISFEIAIHQGCRLSETSLPMSQIDEAAGTITFRQKGDRVFTTRLHDGLRPLVAELRTATAERTCVLPQMAAKQWHWLLKGRPERNWKAVAPRLCFHCTRVTVITRLARGGVPIQQAMAYVGHADQEIHRIYQRLQAPDLSRCLAALSF
jgi:integrase